MTSPAPTPAAPRAASPWILGPAADLALFVATPVVILPAILLVQTFAPSSAIHTWVMAFGAMGHHLPGMMRAYGDRALFARFRTRFIVAPLVLGALCVAGAVHGLQAMLLVAYGWGVWHGLMQTYGFARIYDAKAGSFAPLTARLDLAVCASWFLGAVIFSDSRVAYLAEGLARAGVPVIGPGWLAALRAAAGAVIGLVTLAFAFQSVRLARRGGFSPVKPWLLGAAIAWWWYANVAVADLLLGLILFEIFHDVQYLTIVWIFNRNRVEKDPEVGAFTRFLFRRSAGLVALYVAAVLAYGGLGPLAERASSPGFRAVMAGVVTFSTLLHFYFDGFIWKVRETATRESLGLGPGGESRARAVAGMRHAFKWTPLVAAAALLAWGERAGGGVAGELAEAEAVTRAAPESGEAWFRLGTLRLAAGDGPGAVAALERSAAIHPGRERVRANLGAALLEAGHLERAGEALRAALEEDPRDDRSRRNLALLLYRAGCLALEEGREEEAAARLGEAGELAPEAAREELLRGAAAWKDGRAEEALANYRRAELMRPGSADVHLHFALTWLELDRLADAQAHARRAVASAPLNRVARGLAAGLDLLSEALERRRRGDAPAALEAARRAGASIPGKSPAVTRLIAELEAEARRR